MFDFRIPESVHQSRLSVYGTAPDGGGKAVFWIAKRSFDVGFCILLLPLLFLFSIVLLVLNPLFNAGPLFYRQKRMGKNFVPFRAIKFRSMAVAASIERGPDDPIEKERISAFGHLLRKSRVDELPQILNVLKGEMSLIGPRPDYYEHALVYLDVVPGYANRFRVRPGISGLAQVVVGYVSDSDGTAKKVAADIAYIENANFKLESWVVMKTIWTIITMRGA